MYQILTVTKAYGMTTIFPSPFCFTDLVDAQANVLEQIETFKCNGEPAEFRGYISTLRDVFDICTPKAEEFDLIANDIYIYELEVK